MTISSYAVSTLTALRAIDMTNSKISYGGFFVTVAAVSEFYIWHSTLTPSAENWGDVIIIPSTRPGGIGAFVKNSKEYSSAGTPSSSPPLDFIKHYNSLTGILSLSISGVWRTITTS